MANKPAPVGATASQSSNTAQASGQSIPKDAPKAPAAPAAKAKAKKQGPDLSKLTPEAKAKFEALMSELSADKKRIADKKRQADEIAGIKPTAKARTATGSSLNGINPDATVTFVTDGAGFKSDEDKAIATKAANGVKLGDLVKQDGVDFGWFRHRFVRGSAKLNGLSMTDIINKHVGKPVTPAQPSA